MVLEHLMVHVQMVQINKIIVLLQNQLQLVLNLIIILKLMEVRFMIILFYLVNKLMVLKIDIQQVTKLLHYLIILFQ